MGRYAAETQVSSARSIEEIQRTLVRYGAKGFQYGFEDNRAYLGLKIQTGPDPRDIRVVKIMMNLPEQSEKQFTHTDLRKRLRSDAAAEKEWEKACRQRWRALALAVKSKLESVESGIETFEEAFFAHIIIPGAGKTFGEMILPEMKQIMQTGNIPKLLPE